jgi:pseudouridine-5'-phosphate glycosidase
MTVVVTDEVRDAQAHGRPVVALESALVARGLPQGRGLDVARELEETVRAGGAAPATLAVLDGRVHVGLDKDDLERAVTDEQTAPLALGDLAPALACGASGPATVSGSAFLAARAGIRVLAAGALTGMPPEPRSGWSVPSGLLTQERTRVTVVCAGVEAALDAAATLRVLASAGVPVLGCGTRTMPGFSLADTGVDLPWTVADARAAADAMRAQDGLGGVEGGMVLTSRVPERDALEESGYAGVRAEALGSCDRAGVAGEAITPHLMRELARLTDGASVQAHVAALRHSAELAARVAAVWSATAHT